MTDSNIHDLRRAWAVRMSRLGMPEYQIAFKIGMCLEELRLKFAEAMQHAVINANIRILQTLEKLAASGRHPYATIFWVKNRCWPKSDVKNSQKSNKTNNKPTYRTEPPPPGSIIVVGMNGERA